MNATKSQYTATARFHERMASEFAKRGRQSEAESALLACARARATALYFRLNADAMNYTPRSHRGMRAARLMPLIRAKYGEGV